MHHRDRSSTRQTKTSPPNLRVRVAMNRDLYLANERWMKRNKQEEATPPVAIMIKVYNLPGNCQGN